MDKSNRTITIKRTFNTPIALVWEAWSDPKHIAKWWNPSGEGTKIVEHSFKVFPVENKFFVILIPKGIFLHGLVK